jgi:hypothetical protein
MAASTITLLIWFSVTCTFRFNAKTPRRKGPPMLKCAVRLRQTGVPTGTVEVRKKLIKHEPADLAELNQKAVLGTS